MNRPRLFALLLSLLLLAACGRDEPSEEPASETPSPDATATEAASKQAATQEVTAWFARFGDTTVWVEPVTVLRPPTEGVARAAMEVLFDEKPANPDLRTMPPPDAELLGVRREGDLLIVDVSREIDPPSAGRGSMEELALAQQLAHTATQFEGVRGVKLLVDGEEIEDLWGHYDWSKPVEPEPFAETPITIEDPGWLEEVPHGRLTASGEANTYEATLAVRLIDPDGKTVEEEWITATSGTGTRGTWEHTFDAEVQQPGTWVVEAEEPDPSGGAEGRKPLVVRQEFRVS